MAFSVFNCIYHLPKYQVSVIGLNIINIPAIFRVYCFISLTIKVQLLLPRDKFYFILITFQWQIQTFR